MRSFILMIMLLVATGIVAGGAIRNVTWIRTITSGDSLDRGVLLNQVQNKQKRADNLKKPVWKKIAKILLYAVTFAVVFFLFLWLLVLGFLALLR